MVSYLILLAIIVIILVIATIAISVDKRREKRAAKCAEMNAIITMDNLANDALTKLIK